jgi:hypothetical protein
MRDGSDAHTPAGAHTCRTRTHLPFALCGTHAAAASKSAAVFHAAGAIAKISHGPNKKDIVVCTNFGAGHHYYYYFSGAGRLAVEQVASA